MRLQNVLVLDNASHNLIGLGRLATEAHVGLKVEATTGSSFLTLPGGHSHRTVAQRRGAYLVVPAASAPMATPPAVVTHGNRESTNGAAMTAELLHACFNHRRAEVIKLLPQCTIDALGALATLARNIACEDCLCQRQQRRRPLKRTHTKLIRGLLQAKLP
eukprot:3524534-Pleurochrysis_carterae.AAC.2